MATRIAFGTEFNTATPIIVGTPASAALPNDRFSVAWHAKITNSDDAFLSAFSTDGNGIGSGVPAATTINIEDDAAVAALPDGRAVDDIFGWKEGRDPGPGWFASPASRRLQPMRNRCACQSNCAQMLRLASVLATRTAHRR